MQDINYGNDFSRGDYFTMESENEAAAYVAGVLYDMYKNQDTHYTSATWLAAKAIALKIKDTPGAEVSDADVRTLRGVISGDPTTDRPPSRRNRPIPTAPRNRVK
jgi:hypothetical protein